MKFDFLTDESEKSLAQFFSPIITSTIFYSVVIIGGLLLMFWPWQGLMGFMSKHRSPLSFSVTFIAALIINSYVNLRCGRGEMVRSAYDSRYRKKEITFEEKNDFFHYGLIRFFLHILFLLVPVLPLLILSTSLSGLPLTAFVKACSIVFTASLLCRTFGFLIYLIWGGSSVIGYFFARVFLVVFLFATTILVPGINPILGIYNLNRTLQSINSDLQGIGVSLTSSYALYMATVILAIVVLAIVSWSLVKHHIHSQSRSHDR